MTNRERADKLFQEVQEIWRGVPEDFGRRSYNLVVRRSQEVVELTLKALLCEMGVDYPKVHDVASIFRRAIKEKDLKVEEDLLEWLEDVSSSLAARRAPAFYLEVDYDAETAKEAMDSSVKVLAFGREFLQRLRSQ